MRVQVSGLARCGTSLMLQMLDAGGYPCWGTPPDYEPPNPPPWDERHVAYKLILPHHDSRNWKPDLVVWLERDIGEQAKSQVKLLIKKHGKAAKRRRAELLSECAANLRWEYQSAHRWLDSLRCIVLYIHWRDLLANTRSELEDLVPYLRGVDVTRPRTEPLPFDIDAALAVKVDRGPECLSYMLETTRLGAKIGR